VASPGGAAMSATDFLLLVAIGLLIVLLYEVLDR
jgi:hypothetical protein